MNYNFSEITFPSRDGKNTVYACLYTPKFCTAKGIVQLVHGMVDYIWYNYRVFFMFWVIVAIICSYYKICRSNNEDPNLFQKEADDNEATLNVIFREI